MKKLVLIAAAVFVVSILGGVGGRMLLAPGGGGADAAPDSSASPVMPKAAVREAIAGASEHVPTGGGDPAAPAGDRESAPAPGRGTPASIATPPDPAASIRSRHADAAGMQFQEMARILGSMKPVEAAIFLAHLDDPQVLGILRSMTVRDAAGLLQQLPEKRADSLRRHLLDFEPEDR